MKKKHWYQSKTLWVNLIALAAIASQYVVGKPLLDIEAQAIILAAVNLVLRLVTGKPLTK